MAPGSETEEAMSRRGFKVVGIELIGVVVVAIVIVVVSNGQYRTLGELVRLGIFELGQRVPDGEEHRSREVAW